MAHDITIDLGARNKASAVLRKVGNDTVLLGKRVGLFSTKAKTDLAEVGLGFKAMGAASVASSRMVTGSMGMMATGIGAAAAAAAGAGLGVAASIKTFGNFDAAMAQVAAVTGATGDQLESMREKAKQLGSTTQFSASQAAEAMKFLGQAGYDADQILGGIGSTLSLAAAGALDLGRAADIASDIATPFGIAASDIGRVADVLATTATSANTTVDMMGESFSEVAAIAGNAGQSIEETATALGLLGNSGVKASAAGTGVKNVLMAMTNETSRAKIEALGVSITDTAGNMRPFLNVMKDVGFQFSKLSESERLSKAFDIFGKIGGNSALILASAGDEIDKLRLKMGQAEGSAKRMADVMQDNLAGVGVRIKSAMEGVAISMVEGVEGPLTEVGDLFATKLSATAEWFNENRESVLEFGTATKDVFTFGIQLTDTMNNGLFAMAGTVKDVLLPPLSFVSEQLEAIDFQFAKAGSAKFGVDFMKWWKGQDFVPTMGGGDSQELGIIKQSVDGLAERLKAEQEVTAEKQKQNEVMKRGIDLTPKIIGSVLSSKESIVGDIMKQSAKDMEAHQQAFMASVQQKLSRVRTFDIPSSTPRFEPEQLFAKESRLKTGAGETQRNRIEKQIMATEQMSRKLDKLADIDKGIDELARLQMMNPRETNVVEIVRH